jgi:poly-gamma-glutamate capsule biosynthesis protein CapA/YwtB (metallophosphatase superfamily)
MVRMGIAALFCLVLAAGCRTREDRVSSTHTLTYGGDVFLGRGLNEALFDDQQRGALFGDAAPLLKKADIALINGEGVISGGGHLFNKGEPRPFLFRAHRFAVEALKAAGIDIVTVGNNHSCDYGTDALREMLHRLRKAGIDYTGGGLTLEDAQTPSYHRVGKTVVAVVGADLTAAGLCRARADRPGVLFYDPKDTREARANLVKDLHQIQKRARRYANLVFLTPHWGDNGMTAPTAETRRLARQLISAGFDGILGHSAHAFQGVEIIDGKPVIYDAGNLLDDLGGARGMLWTLRFNAEGVTGLSGIPLMLSRNRTSLAKGGVKAQVLKILRERSRALGTTIAVKDGAAVVACRPGRRGALGDRPMPPKRRVPKAIAEAPNDLVRDALPEDVTPATVTFDNGITLVGYKLFADELFVPKAAQVVELFFETDRPVGRSVMVHLEAVTRESHLKNTDRHLPGDWLMPTERWSVGKIITDRKLFRLKFPPEGTVDFSMALFDGRFLEPTRSTLPVGDRTRIHLGEATYSGDAGRIYSYIYRIVRDRMQRAARGSSSGDSGKRAAGR